MFGVDGVHLTISCRLGEEGGEEKLTESIQGPTQVVRADVKVVICVVTRGESIEATPVLAQVLAVFVLVWELLCA